MGGEEPVDRGFVGHIRSLLLGLLAAELGTVDDF
jgi:hypothetical protein